MSRKKRQIQASLWMWDYTVKQLFSGISGDLKHCISFGRIRKNRHKIFFLKLLDSLWLHNLAWAQNCAFHLAMQIAFWIFIQLSYFYFSCQACQVIAILQLNKWKLRNQPIASFFFSFLPIFSFCGYRSFSIVMTLSTTCAPTRWPLTMPIVQLEIWPLMVNQVVIRSSI